jgi:hypothetical protein
MSDFMQGDPDRQSSAVPFSDDEKEKDDKPEELLAEIPPTATPEERIDRKRKQEERVRRLLDEGKQNKEKVKGLEEEQATLRRELAELRAQVRQPPPPATTSGKDPYEEQLDAVFERQREAYTAAQAEIKAGTWNDERQRHYENVARAVETDKARILIAQGIARDAMNRRAESAQQVWVNKYPEVYANPRAYQFAAATFERRKALLGPNETVTNDLIDEVMSEAITQFKLGKKSAPSASEKSRLSGVPSSGTGGGSSRSEGIQMTPELRRMAVAAYSELPEAEAVKKWVNGTGKRLREKKIL